MFHAVQSLYSSDGDDNTKTDVLPGVGVHKFAHQRPPTYGGDPKELKAWWAHFDKAVRLNPQFNNLGRTM